MSIGAVFGRIVGSYMEYLTRAYADAPVFAQCPSDSRCVIPGIYALVGAGATLTGTTHTTIAVVAILMELTGNLIYTLPVLLGVMTARWVAQYFNPSGIYDLLLEHAGHPYFDTKTQYIHTRRTAAELMQTDLETICVDYENENTMALLTARLARISDRGLADGGFPVVNVRGHLLGWIACAELEFAISRCHGLEPSLACFFNNPLWQMDYVAQDPTAIPHYRTPVGYVKAKAKAKDKNSKGKGHDASETSLPVDQVSSSPLDKLRKQWKQLRASNDLATKPLLDVAMSAQLPSYQSSEQTASSDHPASSSKSSACGDVLDTNENDTALPEILGKSSLLAHNCITLPHFQDRPNDFTPFVDQTPLTISTNSPIELVANLLSRLGVSYLCVVDKGVYCGVIFKKAYIGYVKELEEAGFTR
ncbi:hypothetical protein GGI03_008162 [Coemansia sp. RSA 2337]|nr:hypothetical protein GGI03_008162 [Coemansia sp. RSA 2337]